MTADEHVLAGIVRATEDEAMPTVAHTITVEGHRIDIIDCVIGGDDGYRRGYLWHAVIGEYVLVPTRPGQVDPSRWVPGRAERIPGRGALLATSTASPKACAANARRNLVRLATKGKRRGAAAR